MVVALSLLAAFFGSPAFAADDWQPPNLVKNGGFETVTSAGAPADWSGDPAVYSAVTQPVHSGGHALQYVNADADRYVLCVQTLPLQPGKAYEISAWIKTDNLQGSDTGATICLEWYAADGQYQGGCYPAGFKGTSDWQPFHCISGRVPPGAATCSVVCYVRQHMTGKAWWDDVEVHQWREPPLHTLLLEPNYRGLVAPGLKQLQLSARTALADYDLAPKQVALRADLVAADGKAVVSKALTPRGDSSLVSLPASHLAPGKYQLKVALEGKRDRRVLGTEAWPVEVLGPNGFAGRVSYIDEHNRLIRDGKPFFPLGMYWGGINEADLKVYSDSAFNCLMPYGMPTGEHLDLAQRYGLKVIYSVKDTYFGSTWCPPELKSRDDERPFIEAKVKEFGHHPAVLAWYLNDELSVEYMDRLEAHQRWLEELDPDHPTWVVLYQVGQLGEYLKTFDAIGTDPYPIPDSPVRTAGMWARMSVASAENHRPVWMVPQVFNWAVYRENAADKAQARPPTLAEMRCMAWQCLAEGARGLIFYHFNDLQRDPTTPFEEQWGRVKQVAAEIRDYIPVLLSVETPPKVSVEAPAWLHWTSRRVGPKVYLLAVNDDKKAHTVTFDLGKKPRSLRLAGAAQPLTSNQAQLTAALEPLGVNIYEMQF